MTEGSGVGEGGTRASLTRRMELTDSVMCRRLISVSSLHRSRQGGLSARHQPLPARCPKGSQPRCPYASFLCFFLVLASEILL